MPLSSLEALASTEQVAAEQDGVNAATGGWFVTPSWKASTDSVTGPFVAVDGMFAATCGYPGACSPAVLSVALSCHAGSAVPAFHTEKCSVVGFVPVTWKCTLSCMLAV